MDFYFYNIWRLDEAPGYQPRNEFYSREHIKQEHIRVSLSIDQAQAYASLDSGQNLTIINQINLMKS